MTFLQVAWRRLQRDFAQLTIGGSWATSLPAHIRHNLRWFWFDGLFASASENILVTYLSLYILALGATRAQIGWMSSLSSLTGALLLFPGALLVERIGYRKQVVLFSGGVMARFALLLLALTPLFFGDSAVVYVAIAFSVLRDAFNNLGFPAWMSLTGDIVPLEGRGRFFSSRNFAMSIAGMGIVLLTGELITRTGQPLGYQLAIGLAFAFGMAATYSFAHLRDPQIRPLETGENSISLLASLREMSAQRDFLVFSLTAALWNFSLNVAGPFFSPYQVQELKASATLVGINSIVSSMSGLLVQRKIGELADRWGPRRVQMISGLLIPLLPLAWIFTRAAWHPILINVFGGALWAAYTLASFNYLLALIPANKRARYSALNQIIVTISLSAGAAVGGLIATQWGYRATFLVSGVGRLIAALLFARFLPEDRPLEGRLPERDETEQ